MSITSKIKSYRGIRDLKRAGEQIDYTPYQIEEYKKCALDPIYFIENYVYVQSVDGGAEVLLKLYPKQKEYIKCIHENKHVLLLCGRQMGKTTITMAYILWFSIFNDNKQCAVLSFKHSGARECLRRYQFAYTKLPKWIQQGVVEYNKGDLTLENGSIVFTAATGPNAITGRSVSLAYVDEGAVLPNNIADEFFASVWPTLSSGKTTKMIMTTTPRGYNHFYHRWKAAEDGKSSFIPFKMHWTDVPWRDEKWLKDQEKELGPIKSAQEIHVSFVGSANTLISGDKIGKLESIDPIFTKDNLDVYEAPQKDRIYITVCDVSRGISKDYSAFTVIDITEIPYKLVAKYRDNEISPMHYPDVISRVSKSYNDAYVLIEIKEAGLEVANLLHYTLEYDNILMVDKSGGRQVISPGYGNVGQLGVMTSVAVKRLGCANFKTLLEEDKLIIHDKDIISEISTFIQVKNSYQADEGYNDDLVMCLVLFGWVTSCEYFKELTNINTRVDLFGKKIKDLGSMMPFPVFVSPKDDMKDLFIDSVGNAMDLMNMDQDQVDELKWLIGESECDHFVMGMNNSYK